LRNRLTVFILLLVAIVFCLLVARQAWLNHDLPRDRFAVKKLRVLTYSSFVGSIGPGSELFDLFKKEKNCDVEVLTAGDAGLLMERLKLAQTSVPVDVVIGLDQLQLSAARKKSNWRPLPLPDGDWAGEAMRDRPEFFLPFDWSVMTFVYREGEAVPPRSFADLTDAKYKSGFALQDPRASTPGMQFVAWVKAVEGAGTGEFLAKFKPNVQSISPSWAFSYGLFKKKQADFVFSYVTSLAFHWGYEKDRSYQVVSLPEGHPVQVEYAGVPDGCRECELGAEFVYHLLDSSAQKIIMNKNYMLPVLNGVRAGTVFNELPRLKTLNELPADVDLSEWDKVFKH
jgi:thiamine transport system substrate-binding protein